MFRALNDCVTERGSLSRPGAPEAPRMKRGSFFSGFLAPPSFFSVFAGQPPPKKRATCRKIQVHTGAQASERTSERMSGRGGRIRFSEHQRLSNTRPKRTKRDKYATARVLFKRRNIQTRNDSEEICAEISPYFRANSTRDILFRLLIFLSRTLKKRMD